MAAALSPEQVEELNTLTTGLKGALVQYPDFPSPGILFEDIMPIFASPVQHNSLVRALELHVLNAHPATITPPFAGIDVVVGLEARGFLFGPSLALRIGAGFVPVRKAGKLPGETVQVAYKKEYGEDLFELQKGAIKPGSRVLIVDDIIATGGTAEAAEKLVTMCGATVVEFCFLMELGFLKGRDKLKAPVFTLLTGQE
ncbi:phosphoribosyltransferase-like protein [Pyronema domesticum]|uniref:adenine phosphoribosyltransferase n=1 Tax=Pyronema omphalodes (strain CBS 100304) TaxID=1076935 RepID=U4LHF0_PYROM|nr:phosphoribosyltransferase-like protein [Pyronema domesticum]CCX31554.1 Similar to Adenine phosphoribosyltransferase; acc. no. Q6CA53 [Pyronema omphalodes CBS 100304]